MQKVTVLLTDDLTNENADETVEFALDGRSYEIDLSAKNAQKLRKDLADFVAHARRLGSARSSVSSLSTQRTKKTKKSGYQSTARKAQNAKIREWAEINWSEDVDRRGRIPDDVLSAYLKATGETRAS